MNQLKSKYTTKVITKEYVKLLKKKLLNLTKINFFENLEAYGIGNGQHQYRAKLKYFLAETFCDKLLFVTTENNSQQVVTSENCLQEQTLGKLFELSEESIIKNLPSYFGK